MYLTGNGYAPVVTVRDGAGNIAMQGPVVAKLQGENYYSSVVIKVPDAKPEQLAFAGFFLPTAFVTDKGVSFSGDPELINPQLTLNSYFGDLGLDAGSPQNVFELDVKKLTPLNARNLDTKGIILAPGSSYTLPNGKGSISFDGVKRYIGVDIHHNPGQLYALIFALLAVAGLVTSLYVNRRRVWVRTGTHEDGRTMVEYGLLARGEDHRLAGEAAAIRKLLSTNGTWARRPRPAPSPLPAQQRIMTGRIASTATGSTVPAARRRPGTTRRRLHPVNSRLFRVEEGSVMVPDQRNHGPVQRALHAAGRRHVHGGVHRLRLGPGQEQQDAARGGPQGRGAFRCGGRGRCRPRSGRRRRGGRRTADAGPRRCGRQRPGRPCRASDVGRLRRAAPRQARARPPTAACATPASGVPPPAWPSR